MNLKITDPGDLAHLESMASGMMESRNGTGLDFHPLKSGRPLVLGGLRLKGDRGPDGHSDGDAVLHAVADAILAAARLGDIGVIFPPDDPRWKDADSRLLLKDVCRRVRHGGWSVLQLDVTVIARYPRISPVREEMIECIAGLLGIDPKRVWVKGTTTNSLGDIGRGKGLGCLASVTLTRRRLL